MSQRKRTRQQKAPDETNRRHQERDASEIQDLPNREAMSILSGLPTIPGLPLGIIGGASLDPSAGQTAPVDPSDPSATPMDTNTFAPTNQATITNVDSPGTTEATGATQDAPITQR